MNQRLVVIVPVLSFLALLGLCVVSSSGDLPKQRPMPIPSSQREHVSLAPKGEPYFCPIQNDQDSIQWFSNEFDGGGGIAALIDPVECGFDSTYPFKISYVHFYLYDVDPPVFTWPAEIRVSIRDIYIAEDTLMPGTRRDYEDFSIPVSFAYDPVSNPFPIDLPLSSVVCVDTAFFLEITYRGGTVGSHPSLVMSDTLTDRPDTNEYWLIKAGKYVEWYDGWYPPIPGRGIMRVTGYPYAIDCDELCWEWMPEKIKAPSGLPDLDQYQFGPDSVAMSGPAAVANLLVWLNAIPSIADPDSLIRLLSHHFGTDPSPGGGTLIDSIQAGLDSVLSHYGLSLRDTVISSPAFSGMADSLKKDIPIALLVGLWQEIDHTWHRIGGHYVSFSGACKKNLWTAFSDPGLDNTETGGRGRFLPPHEPHAEDHTLHNLEGFVSHDAYLSDTLSVGPYAGAWILRDLLADSLPWASQFEGLNFQPDQQQYAHSYDPAVSLYAVVEYAVMILEKPTLVEEEQNATPRYFELFPSYPNPFNNQTVIKYSLSRPAEVSLVVYNVLGQKVRTLVKEERQSGQVSASWDGRDDRGVGLSSGIYFYRLQAGESSQTRRMVLLK